MTEEQKKRWIKIATAAGVIFCIGILIGPTYRCSQNEVQETEAVLEAADSQPENTAKPEDVKADPTEIPEAEVPEPEEAEAPDTVPLSEDWKLLLVNRTHPVPEDFQVELIEIADGHQMDVRIYKEFQAMIRAAKAEGIYLYVTSSYRTLDKQTELHEKKINYYISKGYSYEQAKEKAAEVVAVPGTSEHHLGLALDFVSPEYKKLDSGQEQTRSFQWMKAHCAEYGFILRYPTDKTEITGIIYEPWHFRYVGKEAAAVIMAEGITLEEYLGAE